jgi:Gpi18-like mannosyltransferase
MLERKRNYILIFVLFFLMESLLSLWTGLPYDMEVWFNTGMWMNQGINIYEPAHHLGYPPLWAFWCSVAYQIYSFFSNSIEVWRFTVKLPMILAHLGLAHVVGMFVANRFDLKAGLRIVFVVLGWAFFVYIGALWGQINPLSVLFTFLAFYAVINQKIQIGAFLLGVAITLKIYPLVTLPAFLIFLFRNRGKKEVGKFLVFSCSIPVIFTILIFTIFQWDMLFFLKTVFYSTPVFESNPVQILGGCMNFWSFVALPIFGFGDHWIFRLLWIPILSLGILYWLRKKRLENLDFVLSIVTLYILFILSYGWVTEQSFLDPLPFIFLIILVYRPRKLHFYFLALIQLLVFAFSMSNWGPFIFEPLAERFFPFALPAILNLDPSQNSLIWNIRGTLGLLISLCLGTYLFLLLNQNHSHTGKNLDIPTDS